MSSNVSNYEQIKSRLEDAGLQEILRKALPANTSVGAWTAAALAYLRTNEDILGCTATSVIGCAITVASFGLRLDGVTGHAYLRALPIKDKDGNILRYEAQLQLGYKGMVELAYRNPEVREIEPVIVYSEDKFEFQKGTQPFLHHTWDVTKSRGNMVAVYAGIRFKGGYYSFQIHDIDDVMALRKSILEQSYIRIEDSPRGLKYLKKPFKGDWREMSVVEANRYPWIGHIVPMILKTAIRWSQKFWPTVGTEFSLASTLSEMDDAGIPQGMGDMGEAYGVQERKTDAASAIRGDLRERMLAAAASKATPVPESSTAPAPSTAPEPAPVSESSTSTAPATAPEDDKKEQPSLFPKTTVIEHRDGNSTTPNNRLKPGKGKGDTAKVKNTSEPTEEEKAEILRREREEWEASQRRNK